MNAGKQAITNEDFSYLEKKYNAQFPDEFKEFYSKNNGADIYLCQFKDVYEVNSFLPLRGDWSIESVKDDELSDGIIPINMIPFADDEGGDFYYINLIDKAIYLIRSDNIERYLLIANSFNEFLEILDNSEMQGGI